MACPSNTGPIAAQYLDLGIPIPDCTWDFQIGDSDGQLAMVGPVARGETTTWIVMVPTNSSRLESPMPDDD